MKELLCIGGSAAGKKFSNEVYSRELRVPIIKPWTYFKGTDIPCDSYDSTETYRREELLHTNKNGKEQVIELWVHDNLQNEKIFEHIFDVYSRFSEIERENKRLKEENFKLREIKILAQKINHNKGT